MFVICTVPIRSCAVFITKKQQWVWCLIANCTETETSDQN